MDEFYVFPCSKCFQPIRTKVNSIIINNMISKGFIFRCSCGYSIEIFGKIFKKSFLNGKEN